MEHKSDSDSNCNWCAQYSDQRIGTGTEGLGNKSTTGEHPNYSIVGIGQNAEKNPGDFGRLADTQTPMKSNQTKAGVRSCRKTKIMIIVR